MTDQNNLPDICMICEGSYPYYTSGVSAWTHELIASHPERTFFVLTLMPPNPDLTMRYQFPSNVVGHSVQIVQGLPEGAPPSATPPGTWEVIDSMFKGLITSKTFTDFGPIVNFCKKYRSILGSKILFESPQFWQYVLKSYEELCPSGSFKIYFSTATFLIRSIMSMLVFDLPKAKMYHSLCTGFAGLLLYRAKTEYQAPCIITEQGIYTNERRIEIAMIAWINECTTLNLAIENKKITLKDFWLNTFFSLAYLCYHHCDEIIVTFDGNQEIQLTGGADPKHMHTVVDGINSAEYPAVEKRQQDDSPLIAFAGRIVPIKDLKTFIRSCQIVREHIPKARFYALGPYEEDPGYYAECLELVKQLGLSESFTFQGKVNLKDYYPEIDLIVLTSLSEAQPRVVMEAGMYGIPSVTTNVGACKQLCYGKEDEIPPLGAGGIVTPLVNPPATAQAILKLLSNPLYYQQCGEAIKKRISTYYQFARQQEAYTKIYSKYIGEAK